MADTTTTKQTAPPNFIRALIEHDLSSGRLTQRSWAGRPSDARQPASQRDGAGIRTRFPPEPNGYLHIGHAKSICLNFGLARDYGGRCHMRFDDTNPVKEDQEYVDSILDTVRWLGFSWDEQSESNLYFASDYFQALYDCAEYLIKSSHAYVDEQSAEQMRAKRGSLTEPGEDSPYRHRSPEESLMRFREMREGKHAEGSMVLRAKIDMRSPNLNLRDPALYRIRFAEHHRTGNQWCIYPMYDYAHPISDALENITHSLCTLEFEDHRPFYDWVLERLAEGGFLRRPLPQQTEFARLNLYYTVTSKRKLQELVSSGRVKGWDDPRMPTLVGLRRRGFTPGSIQLFCERIGVSKANQWVDPSVLEIALRDDLEPQARRATAVMDPVLLEIENWPQGHREACEAPWHPQHPGWGQRQFHCTGRLWVERDDVRAVAEKGFFRLFPGNRVRLRYGFVIECRAVDVDSDGKVLRVVARYFADSRSGTAGADSYKVKGNIHWVSVDEALAADVHLYENLFTDPQPDSGEKDWLSLINQDAHRLVKAWLEPSLAKAQAAEHFQFERLGYFVADRLEHSTERPVFQRTVGLKQASR
ncbi:MAG: glutamine--tRNA ligase/YqeY domain fusion protein [Burkholderiales bacterium]